MSHPIDIASSASKINSGSNEAIIKSNASQSSQTYKGFIAGVFSGVAKLTVGHPFDTIKVRLQTSLPSQFHGPISCLVSTLRHEGPRALYKGATPPLVGWMFMDSVMLGSLTLYRRLLLERGFFERRTILALDASNTVDRRLSTVGHATAGLAAGWTVSFVAAPVEHIKARLQIQYAADKSARFYSGPIDCTRRILQAHGIAGLYRGLTATLLFRSWFWIWWGSYDILNRQLEAHTDLTPPAINFLAGGLSAQAFWIAAYPSDVIKQRIMTDPLGGALADGTPRFHRWIDAARAIAAEGGAPAFWRGFAPCFLRAFPANAVALLAFEAVMRSWRL